MTCEGIDRDELVGRYLRSELDLATQDEFETHILECSTCLQRVEMMLSISQGLQERAPTIRATQDKGMPWWKWAPALAAVLVLGAAVSILLIKHSASKQTASSNVQPSGVGTPSNSLGGPKAGEENQSDNASSTAPTNPQIAEKLAAGNHSAELNSAPPQSRESGSVKSRSSGSGESGTRNQATQQPTAQEQASNPDGTATQAPPGAITAGIGSQLPLAPGEGVKNSNDEGAKELFRLGAVQPPPYTFSGLAASTKVDGKQTGKHEEGLGAAMPTGQPENAQPPGQGRTYFQNAMGAYVERRYADAVPLLEADLDLEPKALDANYYLGICLLLLAQPADAIAPLKTVATSNASALAPPAHFYLAKAYLQVEDLDNAETELRVAGAGSGRLAAEARATLRKLQALKTKQ